MKPKVCTKLFPRHNSDSIIPSPITSSFSKTNNFTSATVTTQTFHDIKSPILIPLVSKENIVKDSNNLNSPISTVRINVPVDIKFSPYSLPQNATPKILKINNFDVANCSSVCQSDTINLTSLNTLATTPISNKSNVTYITPIKPISAGDTFKAYKIGNTLQLIQIPQDNKCDASKVETINIHKNHKNVF